MDEKNHGVVKNNGDDLCSCGKVMAKGSETRTSQAHTFDSKGVCTACGYKKVHVHKAAACGKPSTSYEKKDGTYHVKVYYNGDNLCSCGAFVSKGTTTRTSESHSFDSNDVCTKCGYKKVHVHKVAMCGIPDIPETDSQRFCKQ